jgi:hypothetical protein
MFAHGTIHVVTNRGEIAVPEIGMLFFGLCVMGIGAFVLLLRKAMGHYASDFWAQRNVSKRHHSEKYWTNASTAQGVVFIGLGALLAFFSFLFR